MQSSGMWKPKGKVWYQKNDDKDLGFSDAIEMDNVDKLSPAQKHELIKILDRQGQSESLAEISRKEIRREAREMRKDSNGPVGKKLMRDIAFRGYR